MALSVEAFLLLLSAVAVMRCFELGVSYRHQRLLAARGVRKAPDPYFRWMVLLHVAVLVSAGLEVVLLNRPFVPILAALAAAIVLLATAIRWWTISALGTHWNVQVMDSVRLGVVSAGPFRFVRHPNYVAVFLELAALPLIHSAWLTAAVGSAAHTWILSRRIAIEDEVLLRDPVYRAVMGDIPRLLPRLAARRLPRGATQD